MGGSPAGQFGFVSRPGTARIDSQTPKIVANLEVRCLDVLDIFTGGLGYYEILGDRFQPNVDILFDRVEDLLATVEHRNLFAVIAGNSDPVSSRKQSIVGIGRRIVLAILDDVLAYLTTGDRDVGSEGHFARWNWRSLESHRSGDLSGRCLAGATDAGKQQP